MNSAALTLGRAKGVVFLGQALRLTVPAHMDAGEGNAALCFEADVFYGDTRQDASRVTVTSEWQPQSQSANVTVSAQSVVDEPVVTVYLRAGCDGKTTRRYVLLAELAATETPSVPRLFAATQKPEPKSKTGVLPPPSKLAQAPATDVAPPASRVTPAASTSAAKSRRESSRREKLKLEPLDWTQDRDPALRLSGELAIDEREDPQRRAQAEALWRSLNATPQDILAIDSRQQAHVSDLRNLQSLSAKNQQLLDGMTSRLERAESGRYSNPLVYGLLVAIVGCGLAAAWLWSRRARAVGLTGEPWWRDEVPSDKLDVVGGRDGVPSKAQPIADGDGVEQVEMPRSNGAGGTSAPSAAEVPHIDIDMPWEGPQHTDAAKNKTGRDEDTMELTAQSQSLPRATGQLDFGPSMSASLLRSVNSKEMLDVRQQAEFFMTLGQNEEAIALLRDSLESGPEADPLVYLELLKVLHTLGRKVEYDHYRNGFHAIFNGYVPVYSDYGQPGSGLEAYPVVCRRIVGLWPSEEVMPYIESCLIRAHKEKEGQIFDLEAFRDLLLLHAIASRLASASLDSGFMAFRVARSAPVADSETPGLDVDLDLSDPHGGNLIDFDASGWSTPHPGTIQRNER
nr:hypothetical protein [uncultured Rhodoferax sp.]